MLMPLLLYMLTLEDTLVVVSQWGREFPIVSSTKQKLNACSLTERELINVDDMMPWILLGILWTQDFLKAQGY